MKIDFYRFHCPKCDELVVRVDPSLATRKGAKHVNKLMSLHEKACA